RTPPVLTGADITLPIVEAAVQILPGEKTRMWTFGGEFPGPTIRRPAGETTLVTFDHRIQAADTLTIHHHGHHTASIDDGQPTREVIEPGTSRLYTYEHVEEGAPLRAAMRWYHDHSHGRTNRNSWMGLMGLFVIDDPAEADLGLPTADRELLLVVTDRTFGEETNQLTNPFDVSDPGADAVGSGDTILVNGVPQPYVEVLPTRYRIRILVAAAFRYYNLGFAAGPELVQVGTESGLLPAAVTRERVLLGPAERADLVVDFSAYANQALVLSSGPEDPEVRRLPGSVVPAEADVMQFRVSGGTVASVLPASELRALPDWVADLRAEADRVFAFGIGIDPETLRRVWTINGRTFDHEHVAARPELGSTETWLLVNLTHGTHSIHIHDVDWKMVSRNGSPPDPAEAGLKETFRLDPGDLLAVGAKFTDHLGPYMIHCHMLSH
ncbi:MAG: multicopper oxidase family protein, partial [Candidatus Binatia bacterium]